MTELYEQGLSLRSAEVERRFDAATREGLHYIELLPSRTKVQSCECRPQALALTFGHRRRLGLV